MAGVLCTTMKCWSSTFGADSQVHPVQNGDAADHSGGEVNGLRYRLEGSQLSKGRQIKCTCNNSYVFKGKHKFYIK